jgi:menaquinone-dependent protoporphyrinogen oxidase
MTVLVAFATAHGSTRTIAETLACRLADEGLSVDVRSVNEVESLARYKAAVVGSAIHHGRWLPEASEFTQLHTAMLTVLPCWTFSVSSIGETTSFFGPTGTRLMRRLQPEPHDVTCLRVTIRPREHRCFAGTIERGRGGPSGALLLTMLGGTYGDHRDIDDATQWAHRITQGLGARHSA